MLAVVGVAVTAPVSVRASELMDKQQAAWWGAPHKDENGNWDEGWLARYVNRHRGARGRDHSQQLASVAVGGREQSELDQIHGLLDKAVGMLGLERQRRLSMVEPARVLELGAVDHDVLVGRARGAADHQR